jgi:hypothetical protein
VRSVTTKVDYDVEITQDQEGHEVKAHAEWERPAGGEEGTEVAREHVVCFNTEQIDSNQNTFEL